MLIAGQWTAGTLNLILEVLQQVLNDANRAVMPSALLMLGLCALLEFRLNFVWLLIDGFIHVQKAIGMTVYLLIKVAFWFYILNHLQEFATAWLDQFKAWSFAITGSAGMLIEAFNQPSIIWDMGFTIAAPLKGSATGILSGWDMMAYMVIVFSFLAIALHVLMALLEFKVALAIAPPLIAMGLLTPLAFFRDGLVRWLAASLVRICILGIMVALSIIVVSRMHDLRFAVEQAGLESGLALAGTAFVLAVMTWFLPSLAAGRLTGGSGGLSVSRTFSGSGLAVVGVASQAVSTIRSTSNLARGR